jgi:hypothetical protein
MKHIDEARLESDLEYRFGYLTEFTGFGEDDVGAIHGAAGLLAPLVPSLVDAVYDQLFSFDCTKRHLVPRQSGYEGTVYEGTVPESVDSLTLDHELVQFRKQHLARYLTALVTKPYDARMVSYLDMVGKVHTHKAGSRDLHVPLVQMNALMGFVSDALLATILGLDLDYETQGKTLRAFNKLLWLQNDLITRHYQASPEPTAADRS